MEIIKPDLLRAKELLTHLIKLQKDLFKVEKELNEFVDECSGELGYDQAITIPLLKSKFKDLIFELEFEK